MSIGANLRSEGGQTAATARTQALEKDLQAAKRGDWEARHRIESMLNPILTERAKKRASSNAEVNALIEAGKKGIATAIKKYKTSTGADRFQIFAVSFIEDKMDKPSSGGFFSRIFGG
ncbi:MAG: hypothetical protein HN341_07590 [Verrucomicrobia bacterium]|jgi:DNA-directed RNA polymerase specialized sigma subunit|nr:hypothetical protein [Verrucomicrobiota bacterium]